MTDLAIETRGLTKVLGGRKVVDDVTFSVAHGEIFGFLGPNGAGKTTTIRLLLGLSRITSGDARILGERVPADRACLQHVGALIEEAAAYPWLTARRNLAVLSPTSATPDDLDAALTAVDLSDVADTKVKTFSQGMRQRLGLAVALCARPRLLILDEPANGLDPAGINWLRGLLRSLAAEGTSIFLSSHQLGEVERTCDRALILHRGRVIDQAPLAELGASQKRVRVRVALQDHERAAHLLSSMDVRSSSIGEFEVKDATGVEINKILSSAGIFPESVTVEQATLEEHFLSITGTQDQVS